MLWRDEFCPELEDPTQIDQTPSSPEIGELSDSVLADIGNEPPTQEKSLESPSDQHVEVEEQVRPPTDGTIDKQLPELPFSHPLREEANEEPPPQQLLVTRSGRIPKARRRLIEEL
jgi:hypothetical protein